MTLDVMSNSPFVSSECKAIWKENLVVNQISLRVFSMHPSFCLDISNFWPAPFN